MELTEVTEITIHKIGEKGFILVSENRWRKNLFDKTYLYLMNENKKWIAELCLVEGDEIIDKRMMEFDGKTIEHLNYACLRLTGENF